MPCIKELAQFPTPTIAILILLIIFHFSRYFCSMNAFLRRCGQAVRQSLPCQSRRRPDRPQSIRHMSGSMPQLESSKKSWFILVVVTIHVSLRGAMTRRLIFHSESRSCVSQHASITQPWMQGHPHSAHQYRMSGHWHRQELMSGRIFRCEYQRPAQDIVDDACRLVKFIVRVSISGNAPLIQ